MKSILIVLALVAASLHVAAEEDLTARAERARLSSERAQIEARFQAEQQTCYGKFSVNDCLQSAKTKRRLAVSDLRRQEISLSDAERKRKAAEQQRSIDERSAAQVRRLESQTRAGAAQEKDRQTRVFDKATGRATQAASAPAKASAHQEQVMRKMAENEATKRRLSQAAAKSAAEHDKREAEAKERRDKLQKRLAERKKPLSKPLPTPP